MNLNTPSTRTTPKNKTKISFFVKALLVIVVCLIVIQLFNIYNSGIERSDNFSIIVLPDTQKYSEKYPKIFCKQTDWIKENISKLNIAFTIHLGDITENGGNNNNEGQSDANGNSKEWQTASTCLGKLDSITPYSVIPGNHDTDISHNKESGLKTYNKYFPTSRFSKNSWYKGNYKDNTNNYQIIKKNGLKILLINLGIEPEDDVLKWAQEIIDQNKDSYTILTTHKYLYDDKPKRSSKTEYSKQGNAGEGIWNKLVKNNCSIKLVLSGHYHNSTGENRLISKNSCGENVHQIIQDYQARENGGNGLLRIYNFMPDRKVIHIKTYSVMSEKFEQDENSEFMIDLLI